MAKVKIILDKDDTLEQVESDLFKAMNHHASGAVHEKETFQDPAMHHIAEHLFKLHSDMYKSMLDEIMDAIDSDYRRKLGN